MARSKVRRQLPLSETLHGSHGADFEDLRWYFRESKAAQSGLKSSQAALEAQMEAPAYRSGHFVAPILREASIRRARRIHRALTRSPAHVQFRLRELFREDHERLYGSLGPLAGLMPSSQVLWTAYRESSSPGFHEFLRHLVAAYSQKGREARRLVSLARRECEARFSEALREYRKQTPDGVAA